MSGNVTLDDDHLVIDFPYDPDQVAEIKKITGAKWDKAGRVWRAPMSAVSQIREFAQKHGLEIEPQVCVFTPPEPYVSSEGIRGDGEYVWLQFAYDPVKVRLVKHISGVTWDAKSKAWRSPVASLAEAISWAERFNLSVPDDLREQLAEIKQRHDEMTAASRNVDAELSIPGLVRDPRPYQRAGVVYAAKSRRCFIADDMGLGKTGQAIMALEFANQDADSYPAVVVCPPKLVLNWAKEYAAWLPDRKVATVVDRKTFPEDGTYDVVVVGWSNISHWAEHLKRHRAYVLDESHACKNPQAARTKAMVKIAKSASADAIILCLTGTPITNRPAEFAPQLQILGKLDKFGGLWGYYRRYCNAFRDKWGHWHLDGSSNLNELNDRLRGEGLYIRRTKEQVLNELPPVIHNPIVVDGDGAAMREYRRAEADIVAYLVERAKQLAAELGVSPGSAAVRARMAAESNEHLVRVSVLRKLAARAKMETVLEWVQEHVDADQKVVIAAHHREIVDELANRFGGLKIQGGQNVSDVERIKVKFQERPCSEAPVLVLSIQAGKEGHTLTAAQDVVFIELPWTPADVDQTYSRCHRMGQTGSVTATYFLCQGTIDEEIFELIQSKRQVVNAAVEGGDAEDVNIAKTVVGKFMNKAFGSD